ncbi:hypothetical protein [Azospirillum sp. sgz302134]
MPTSAHPHPAQRPARKRTGSLPRLCFGRPAAHSAPDTDMLRLIEEAVARGEVKKFEAVGTAPPSNLVWTHDALLG